MLLKRMRANPPEFIYPIGFYVHRRLHPRHRLVNDYQGAIQICQDCKKGWMARFRRDVEAHD